MGDVVEYLLKAAGALLVAGAVYGGIRNDLKNLHEKATAALRLAGRAHDKIDGHINDHARGGHGY